MKAEEVFIPGAVGTTFMTVFSDLMGDIEQENFSEPDLLSKLFGWIVKQSPKELNALVGWGGHYAIGALFALVYAELWKTGKIKPYIKSGLLLGGISGIAAIGVWSTAFAIHPNPTKIKYNKYFTQLWFAHVVFAGFATVTYKMIREQQQNKLDQKYLSIVKP